MSHYVNPSLTAVAAALDSGKVAWRSPSNLALIKYWGKHGRQLPRNASVSLTLSAAHTNSHLSFEKNDKQSGIDFELRYDGIRKEAWEPKTVKFLNSISDVYPFLNGYTLQLDTINSFPHSAGIASSASGMSALALCLVEMEQLLFGTEYTQAEFLQKVSYLSRLGSGSACRSMYPYLAAWGETLHLDGSSDLFGVPVDGVHEVFKTMRNYILIAGREEKSVSSTAGHALMDSNLYADVRYKEADLNFGKLMPALYEGDVKTMGEITEHEALTLHALMMTSHSSYILLLPNTLILLQKIRAFRADTGVPVYFSLDAGPNPHVLVPDAYANQVESFIESELLQHCHEGMMIKDQVGLGSTKLA